MVFQHTEGFILINLSSSFPMAFFHPLLPFMISNSIPCRGLRGTSRPNLNLGPLVTLALNAFTMLASLAPSFKRDFANEKLASAVRPLRSMYCTAGIGSCRRTASAWAQFSCPFLNLQRKQMCLD
jgi:hypothetical protein